MKWENSRMFSLKSRELHNENYRGRAEQLLPEPRRGRVENERVQEHQRQLLGSFSHAEVFQDQVGPGKDVLSVLDSFRVCEPRADGEQVVLLSSLQGRC